MRNETVIFLGLFGVLAFMLMKKKASNGGLVGGQAPSDRGAVDEPIEADIIGLVTEGARIGIDAWGERSDIETECRKSATRTTQNELESRADEVRRITGDRPRLPRVGSPMWNEIYTDEYRYCLSLQGVT